MPKKRIALRIDDVFACTKKYEVYGREYIKLGSKGLSISAISNFLFLKYTPGFRKRLPYRELNSKEWESILEIIERNNIRLTVGITAAWVEKDSSLVPFFEKFPKEAEALKHGLESGLIEIANHGYTHCVVGRHLPRLFASNRNLHREFWSWVPLETHQRHIMKSQELISQYFNSAVLTFIPPGNVWTKDTERFAYEYGLRYLTSREAICPTGTLSNGLLYLGDASMIAFHDREVVLKGIGWFEDLVKRNLDKEIVTVQELSKDFAANVEQN
ncbi:MAG TPA: polysaccharide deacetylase family protein [Candidatus Omnitrophota bacterium]|nr:polysaccharide deacetylase family protein [Candidatus Omnitrophota bacterium]